MKEVDQIGDMGIYFSNVVFLLFFILIYYKTSLKAFSHQRRAKPFNTLRTKADSFEKCLF